jgi:hypothetical protein
VRSAREPLQDRASRSASRARTLTLRIARPRRAPPSIGLSGAERLRAARGLSDTVRSSRHG